MSNVSHKNRLAGQQKRPRLINPYYSPWSTLYFIKPVETNSDENVGVCWIRTMKTQHITSHCFSSPWASALSSFAARPGNVTYLVHHVLRWKLKTLRVSTCKNIKCLIESIFTDIWNLYVVIWKLLFLLNWETSEISITSKFQGIFCAALSLGTIQRKTLKNPCKIKANHLRYLLERLSISLANGCVKDSRYC